MSCTSLLVDAWRYPFSTTKIDTLQSELITFLPEKSVLASVYKLSTKNASICLSFFCLSTIYQIIKKGFPHPHWIYNPNISILYLYFSDPMGLFLSSGFMALSNPVSIL